MTRLSNNRAFGMELRKEISRSRRNEKPLTMLLMQVDNFRGINETYGHLSGDFAVKTIEAMCKLVDDQIASVAGVSRIPHDVLPREYDLATLPGLPRVM